MDLIEVLDQIRALLRHKGRLTYRMLKAQFQLDEESLDALKAELIEGEQVATDENGRVLVWAGDRPATLVSANPPPPSSPPASYTPKHLAERILTEQAAMETRVAPRASARLSRPCLPTSKAPLR
jgi:hypothetical protein